MKKNILITGAAKGIGFECARQLGQLGHHVIITARKPQRLDEALQKLNNQGIQADALLLDISDDNSIAKAAAELKKKQQKLDVLINNAAVLNHNDNSLLSDDLSVYLEAIGNNSTGTLRVIRGLLPLINTPGKIINVSSGGGSLSSPTAGGFAPAYCVSKTLLNGITKQLAFELSGKNIAINAVCPGWVKTDMGGAGAPRPVEKGAETIVWLATEAAQGLSGKFFRDKKEITW